jgi:hypothetical protein
MAINGINTVFATYLSYPAQAYTDLRQFEDAWPCIDEAFAAVNRTKERWWETEVNRIAGEIALQTTEPNAAKAEIPVRATRADGQRSARATLCRIRDDENVSDTGNEGRPIQHIWHLSF